MKPNCIDIGSSLFCGWNDFSANSCAICITEPCHHKVSNWKEMQHKWLFFMFAMIFYSSELYQGVANIIPNILDSLNFKLLGTIVSSNYRSPSLYIYFHQGSKVNINDVC